ncbi:hypothetical protein D3C81_1927230 [compost metagenome]
MVVDFAAGFDELSGADFYVLGHADGQVLVGAHFADAVQMGDAVFFNLEFAQRVGFDGVVPFVADADFLVVLDVFVPIALGVDVDLLDAFFVFDTEFVVALAAR